MSLKSRFEKFLRNQIARGFSKVNEFETQKFIDEVSKTIAQQANARDLNDAMRHKLLYQIQQDLYPKFVMADEGRVLLEDSPFRELFIRYSGDNWTSFERKWNLKELLKQTHRLQGHYAECGVFRGGSAHLMCADAKTAGKHVYLFDSFEGLSNPQTHENFHWTQGDLAVSEEEVCRNLAEFQNFDTFKGWIPDRFNEVADQSFSFVHIDVDLEQPTKDSISFFYPRLAQGGILLLDDHGSAMCPGARSAALSYFADKEEEVLDLATGQGLLIKQQPLTSNSN